MRHASLAALLLVLGAAPQSGAVALFNGKDLSGFATFLRGKGANQDPDRVFSVKDGILRVSGEEYGYLATEREYENYHLTVEFKWGEETFGDRKTKARDSGILFHMTGADGIWPRSHEFQLIEGGTGDLILIGGASVAFDEALRPRLAEPESKMLSPDGKRIVKGRVDWDGRSPQWKDALGFRGTDDLEKAHGEWNVLELICDGPKYTYVVNGREALACTGADPAKGRILFQSEGAELFFRRIELKQLK